MFKLMFAILLIRIFFTKVNVKSIRELIEIVIIDVACIFGASWLLNSYINNILR